MAFTVNGSSTAEKRDRFREQFGSDYLPGPGFDIRESGWYPIEFRLYVYDSFCPRPKTELLKGVSLPRPATAMAITCWPVCRCQKPRPELGYSSAGQSQQIRITVRSLRAVRGDRIRAYRKMRMQLD